jgi:hypothetical protein
MCTECSEPCVSSIRVDYSACNCIQRSLDGTANVIFVINYEYCSRRVVSDIWPAGGYRGLGSGDYRITEIVIRRNYPRAFTERSKKY